MDVLELLLNHRIASPLTWPTLAGEVPDLCRRAWGYARGGLSLFIIAVVAHSAVVAYYD